MLRVKAPYSTDKPFAGVMQGQPYPHLLRRPGSCADANRVRGHHLNHVPGRYAGRGSSAVWNGCSVSIGSTVCVFTSHLNCCSTILSCRKSTSVKPCSSSGFTCSTKSSTCDGSAGVLRNPAAGQPRGRVPPGP